MRKILLMLGFLMMTFLCLRIYAQPLLMKTPSNTTSAQTIVHASPTETSDDLATELVIYSLIVGVYTLYWLKQRA